MESQAYSQYSGDSVTQEDTSRDPSRPQILVVSDEMAWPLVSGMRRRLAQCLDALDEVGDVEWVACPRSGLRDDPKLPPGSEISAIVIPTPDNTLARRSWNWMFSRRPWTLAGGDWNEAGQHLANLARKEYDLVWAAGFDAWLAATDAGIAAKYLVIDAADVESVKLQSRLDAGSGGGLGGLARRFIGAVDLKRWRSLEDVAGRDAAVISVCSEAEGSAITGTVWVTPNSYPDPAPSNVTRAAGRLLFVGSLSYKPNIDGLEFFASDVFRQLLSERPGLVLRVVGRGLGSDHWLRREPGIEIWEDVAEIGPEVAAATLAVVPLPWGGGTRLKIIEAFAYATPVVSTTIGAEGLGAMPGEMIAIADSAAGLVATCRRLLDDPDERARIGRNGRAHFEQNYEADNVGRELVSRLQTLLLKVNCP